MPPKIVKRSRSGAVACSKRVKKAIAPIQQLPVDIQARIALFLLYPEEVRMHFLWPKKALHTPWYMERRVSEMIHYNLYLNCFSTDTARRYEIYKENTKDYPTRLVNVGEHGSVYLFRKGHWGVSGFNDIKLAWTPEMFADRQERMESW